MYELGDRIYINSVEIWAKLIRRETMIATLDYLNGKGVLELFVPNAQDQLVTFYLYHFARSLMVLREYGVYYYKRPGSATDMRRDKVRTDNAMMSHFTVVNTF